jgi:hypothetical protein
MDVDIGSVGRDILFNDREPPPDEELLRSMAITGSANPQQKMLIRESTVETRDRKASGRAKEPARAWSDVDGHGARFYLDRMEPAP